MNKKKFALLIPFIVLGGILIYTWITIVNSEIIATGKHLLGLALYVLCLTVFFYRPKYGVFGVAILIILATVNVIAIFPTIATSSYFVRIGDNEISTPYIQWKAFLLLILYFVCVGGYLQNLYLDHKYKDKSNVE